MLIRLVILVSDYDDGSLTVFPVLFKAPQVDSYITNPVDFTTDIAEHALLVSALESKECDGPFSVKPRSLPTGNLIAGYACTSLDFLSVYQFDHQRMESMADNKH